MEGLPFAALLVSVAIRTTIILVALVAGIRVFGKRDVGGMNTVDLVLVLLLGNAVQNAVTTGSGRLAVGLVSAATLLLIDQVLGVLFVRRPWLEARVYGEPTILGANGQLDQRALQREGVSEDEVLQAVREQGLTDLSDVRLAVLEADGTVSIVPREGEA